MVLKDLVDSTEFMFLSLQPLALRMFYLRSSSLIQSDKKLIDDQNKKNPSTNFSWFFGVPELNLACRDHSSKGYF